MLMSATSHRRRQCQSREQKEVGPLGLLPFRLKPDSNDGRLYILYRKA